MLQNQQMETELILDLQKLMEEFCEEMKEFREEVKEFREQWKSQADSTGDDTDEDEDLTVLEHGAGEAYSHDDSHSSVPEHSDNADPDDDFNCDDADVLPGLEFGEDENGLNADIDETDVVLKEAIESAERKNRKTFVSAPELFDKCSKEEYGVKTPRLTLCLTNTMTSSVDTSKKVLIVYVLQPSSEILFEITKLDSSHDWGGVVLWNSMIGEHVTNNEVLEAFKFYTKIREFGTKESTFISLLSAYCTTGDLSLSKQVHSHACKFGVVNNLIVATGLVDMYAKCRCTNDACRLFGELEMYDTVLLNSMITIYFSMISACVNISPLELGEQHFVLEGNLLMLAGSTLLKQVTENSLSVQLRLDIRNYVNSYLASRGPELQSFVTASLIQLLCRGWFDDDRCKEVVKDSMHFLSQATSDHYAIGLKILNQLVY